LHCQTPRWEPTKVEPSTVFQCKERLLPMSENIRLGLKCLTVTQILVAIASSVGYTVKSETNTSGYLNQCRLHCKKFYGKHSTDTG